MLLTELSSPDRLRLDAAENRAVSVFVRAGLVNPQEVAGLHARRESVERRALPAMREAG